MPNTENSSQQEWLFFLENSQPGCKRQIGFSRLGEILQSLGDNAWVHDFESGNTWYSAEFNDFIGYSNKEISARKADILWWKAIHPEDHYLLEESDRKYKNGEQVKHSLEYRMIDSKGEQRWVLDRGVVVEWDNNSKPLVVAGTHIDMTLLRKLRQQLDQAELKKKDEIISTVIRHLEADRQEIALELHGNINQILAAARMMLEFMPEVNEESGRYTEKIRQIIYTAVDEVNKIFNDINPDALHHVDIGSLVSDLIQRLNKDRHFKVDLDLQGYLTTQKKNDQSELTIYRVIQYVLKTIFLHAKGELIKVRLSHNASKIELTVFTDDPDFSIPLHAKDLNSVSLSNRCAHFGGGFSVEKSTGMGVYFRASVSA
jgi:PAS domain S-box-containing protein